MAKRSTLICLTAFLIAPMSGTVAAGPFGPCHTCATPVPMMPAPVMPLPTRMLPMAPLPMPVGCGTPACGTPVVRVVPVMPAPVVQTTLRPVVQTEMRPQTCTTYEQVARTETRRETYQVTVPVTTQKQVTVDEGGYQMVWVAKPVTKTVSETTYRQETRERDVNFQVVETVPKTFTRMVPEQRVTYVPETRVVNGCAPFASAALPGTIISSAPATIAAVPATETLKPVPSPYPVTETTGAAPTPATTTDGSEWTTIKKRTAESGNIQQQSFEQAAPVTAQAPRRLFSPVPSAAAVWQSQLRR